MTDIELLVLYHQTRDNLLDTCGYDSTAEKTERHAAIHEHNKTLELIEARFPGIKFTHSTAQWYLHDAIIGDDHDV